MSVGRCYGDAGRAGNGQRYEVEATQYMRFQFFYFTAFLMLLFLDVVQDTSVDCLVVCNMSL